MDADWTAAVIAAIGLSGTFAQALYSRTQAKAAKRSASEANRSQSKADETLRAIQKIAAASELHVRAIINQATQDDINRRASLYSSFVTDYRKWIYIKIALRKGGGMGATLPQLEQRLADVDQSLDLNLEQILYFANSKQIEYYNERVLDSKKRFHERLELSIPWAIFVNDRETWEINVEWRRMELMEKVQNFCRLDDPNTDLHR